jgi:polyhydroxybutyrate depolymerase
MRSSVVIVFVVVAVGLAATGTATAAVAGPCSIAPPAGSYTVTLASGGLQRSALVHVPPGLAAGGAVPLLLALHGAYGNGPFMQSYSGFSKLADRDDFIVVYPSAAGRFWNISEAAGQPDDVTFIAALITDLESGLCIDRKRVFATGVSNGGGMVALLGCVMSATFAGVATVAGEYDTLPPCRPSRPVSLLEIHGTADRIAPYFGRRGHSTAAGLPPLVTAWAGRDGCSNTPAGKRIASRTTEFRWKRCRDGTTVEHIRIAGGAHQWPGATPPDPGPPPTILASSTVWSFFAALGPQAPGSGGAPL